MKKKHSRPFMLCDYLELANDLQTLIELTQEHVEEGTELYKIFQNVFMLACEGLQSEFGSALELDRQEAAEAGEAGQKGLYVRFTLRP